jgi:hypothetical protein
MNPLEARRREDLRRVRALCERSGGRLRFVLADSEAPSEVRAGDALDLRIVIPAGYPFRDGPRTFVSPSVWHPNVFPDGQICQGRVWRLSEFLDLYVQRMLRIVTFQDDGINLGSIANGPAAAWFRGARVRFPDAFPTDAVDAPAPAAGGVGWKDAG